MSLVMRTRARRVSTLFLGRKGTGTGSGTSSLDDGGASSSSKRGGESLVIEKRGAAAASSKAQAKARAAEASCPICQEVIGARSPDGIVERWSSLPCGHRFGSYCIKHYLRVVATEGPSCPVCRQQMHHSCGHPIMPEIASPSTRKKDADITSAFDDERSSLLLHCRVAQCAYCSEKRTDRITVRPANDRKPLARVSAAIRWLPFGFLNLLERRKPAEMRTILHPPGSLPARPPTPAAVDVNRARQESASNGDWQGPWVDPFPRPRDEEWEKWWIAQDPHGA